MWANIIFHPYLIEIIAVLIISKYSFQFITMAGIDCSDLP